MGSAIEDGHYWTARFQQAALEPARWIEILGELADATGSTRGELIGVAGKASLFDWISASDEAMVADFDVVDGHSPQVNYRVAAQLGTEPFAVVHEADYDRARRLLASEAYVDFCERQHMPFGCQTTLLRGDGVLVGLSVLRSRRDGRTDERQRKIFARAAPGALVGVRMQRAMEDQGFALLNGTFEAMSTPCLLLDGTGAVRALTAVAEQALAQVPSLVLRARRLGSRIVRDDGKIQKGLAQILAEDGPALVRIAVPGNAAAAEAVLELYRLPRQPWSMHFAPRAMIAVRLTRSLTGVEVDDLARLLATTRTEADVALRLYRGQSREEIAAGRGVSLETVRGQLKSLYAKTGCRREAELILLVKSLIG